MWCAAFSYPGELAPAVSCDGGEADGTVGGVDEHPPPVGCRLINGFAGSKSYRAGHGVLKIADGTSGASTGAGPVPARSVPGGPRPGISDQHGARRRCTPRVMRAMPP